MADLSGMSDEDLKAAYGQAQGGLASMSDDDLKAAYTKAQAPQAYTPTPFAPPLSGAHWDQYFANQPKLSTITQAFGQGFGSEPFHWSADAEDAMRKSGMLNDVSQGQNVITKAFNEGIVRPAVMGLATAGEAAFRTLSGVTQAGLATLESTVAGVTGSPSLARDVAGIGEMELTKGGEGEIPHPLPREAAISQEVGRQMLADVAKPPDFAAARANRIIGVGEEGWKGTVETPYSYEPGATGQAGEPMAPYATTVPTNIHEAARNIAPDTFQEYDALDARKQELRDQISEKQAELQRQAQAQAPHAAEIADLQQRLQDTTPRLAKKYEARLAELQPEHDAFLADQDKMALLTRDTPEIQAMRQDLMATDYRMRDLAPDVTAAYRDAGERFPVAEDAEPQAIQAQPEQAPAAEAAPPAERPAVAERPPQPEPAALEVAAPQAPEQPKAAPVNIASDVAQKLVAAGRPAEEAQAAGAVQEALWRTRAEAFGGRKGTAEEMYTREAPEIRAGVRARKLELAQRGRELEQKKGKPREPNAAPSGSNGDGLQPGLKGQPNSVSRDPSSVPPKDRTEADWIALGHPPAEAREIAERWAKKVITTDPQAKLQTTNLEKFLTDEGLDFTTEASRSVSDHHGPSNSLYYKITKDGKTITVRLSDHYYPSSAEVDLGYGDRQGPAFAKILRALGRSVPSEFEGPPRDLSQTTRGKIRLTEDGRAVITLFKDANASTFLHETGHDWLERMVRDGADPDAAPHMASDAATVRKYLGNDGGDLTTAQHEKFARSFERYFMEGRAPSSALARVFEQFKSWLTTIYQTVARLRAPITDDIRDVFDRLLTTNPEARATIAPDRQGDLELSGHAAVPRAVTPFMRLPQEPKRLIQFLKEGYSAGMGNRQRQMPGGLKDLGGDVSSIIGGPKGRPGLLNKNGMEIDQAIERAHEAGYFPEHESPGTIYPQDLFDKISEDHRGNPQYSMHDQDAASAFHEAVAHNAEVDRLASQHGIDPAGLTAEQFFDKVAEKVDHETIAHEVTNLEASATAEAQEIEHEIRDTSELSGYSAAPARTLEDLENAYGQEATASAVGSGEGVGARPGTAPGPEGQGQGGDGQDGNGAGPAGRLGAEAGPPESRAATAGRSDEQPTAAAQPGRTDGSGGPNQRYERPASDLIDKAGNIRLDNLNQPEDVNQVIRETAEQNGDFMGARRGVIPDAMVLDLADALGMSTKELSARKLGQAWNAEQIVAARKLLIDSANHVRDLMTDAASGDDAAVMRYAEAKDRHRMIQEQVSGITAEAGRALRAFRALEGQGDAEAINDILKGATGRTLFQLRQEAQLGLKLETPAQVSKFVADSYKPDFWDMATEYFINNLISNPVTHTTYAIGNELLALTKALPETMGSAAIGSAREMLGLSTEDRVQWGEVKAGIFGLAHGTKSGMLAAGKALLTGEPVKLPGEKAMSMALQVRQQGAIPGALGEVVRLPGRMVAAIHAMARFQNYEMNIAQMAYRQATKEGLEGDAFAARLADLTQNPPADMMAAARTDATEATLMGRGGEFSRAVVQLSNSRLMGTKLPKLVIPFAQISSNIMEQGILQRTPIGLLSPEIRQTLSGAKGAVARDTQIARMAVGSALGGMALFMTAQGHLTGSEPTDPKLRAAWRATGKQAYSIRVGDTWYSYNRLGVLAKPLGLAADMWNIGEAASEKDAGTLAAMISLSFSRLVLDESSMRGLSEALDASNDPQRAGPKWISGFAAGFVPYSMAVNQLARDIDPYQRVAHSILDKLKARIPGESETLPERVDVWGQYVPQSRTLGGLGVASIYESQESHDPTVQRLFQLQSKGQSVWPTMPEQKVRGVQLDSKQYEQLAVSAGRLGKQRLDAFVNLPGFQAQPEGVQAQIIRETMGSARETARSLLLMQNPDIITKAMKARQALVGGPH